MNMLPRILQTWVVLFLVISPTLFAASVSRADSYSSARKRHLREKVRKMFYHAYENYLTHAFPHDELKPLTKSFTDSLSELGNLKLEHLPQDYSGSALSLIESLSSLVILGNNTEFERGVLWLSENLTFDVDARVNLFECNIRVLGGLVSAHILATDSANRLVQGSYNNQLLTLAEDLGRRFLPAFNTPTGLPYAWINLKYGVIESETSETSTSGCGSLILEMGALSRLTGDPIYESVALRALRKLWSMRSSLNLVGTTLDVTTGQWIGHSSGIGAGVDSFYEYLFKAHILFGKEDFWRMFQSAYLAVQKYFRHGPWYHEADMRTGKATYWQLTSLQAFWPGLQVLVGDIAAANSSHREFFHVWQKFGVLPERYLLDHQIIHPTEKYYPLRPEFAESTFYLYQATKDPWYIEVGESIVNSLNSYAKVEGGFASIRDVNTMQLEDHQHSFFLAETCKYLYLLFDDSFLVDQNIIFTTEGHPLPVLSSWHEKLPEAYIPANWTFPKSENQRRRRESAMTLQVCPATTLSPNHGDQQIESACHIPDVRGDHRCLSDEDCGVDSTNCRKRSCSTASYCGLWLSIHRMRTTSMTSGVSTKNQSVNTTITPAIFDPDFFKKPNNRIYHIDELNDESILRDWEKIRESLNTGISPRVLLSIVRVAMQIKTCDGSKNIMQLAPHQGLPDSLAATDLSESKIPMRAMRASRVRLVEVEERVDEAQSTTVECKSMAIVASYLCCAILRLLKKSPSTFLKGIPSIINTFSDLQTTKFGVLPDFEMETVVKTLQPGPLGIVEHKFSAEEIHQANATVLRAVENWRRNAMLEHAWERILEGFYLQVKDQSCSNILHNK
ncbi:hypothetical protein QYF36_002963 [Acer negundo]|nr:hypothetical protein QYF36_002963 [Acer negundo]